jgi:predicted DNA-binding transcriptional regulator AlpA
MVMDDDAERIILEAERKRITGVGRSKWYELEAVRQVPERRAIVGNRSGWLYSEIQKWIRSRPIAKHAPPYAALRARGINIPETNGDAV